MVNASCGGAFPLNASSVWKMRTLVFHFSLNKMNLPESSQNKRPYRMSARADTANATAERLLEAAWRHFATRPYEQVRLREIRRRGRGHGADAAPAFSFQGRAAGRCLRVVRPAGDRQPAPRAGRGHRRGARAALRPLRGARSGGPQDALPGGPSTRDQTDDRRRTRLPSPLGADDIRAPAGRLSGKPYERRLAAILLATDLLAWKLLRQDMRLDRERSEQVIAEMIQSLPPASEWNCSPVGRLALP